jgi:hypothetical protein
MSENDARWFGEVIRVRRPELVFRLPPAALGMLAGTQPEPELVHWLCRNPGDYIADPIGFLR